MLCPLCQAEIPGARDLGGIRYCPSCLRILPPEPPPDEPVDDLPEVLPADEPTSAAEDLPEVLPADGAPAEAGPGGHRPGGQSRPGLGARARGLAERAATGYARHLLAKVLVLILFTPLGGVTLIWIQLEEGIPYHGSGPEPQVIACKDLLARGPGDNLYVELTEFRLEIARRTTDSFFSDDYWKKAWVPAVPADADEGRHPARLLLETDGVYNPRQLEELQRKGRIRGMVYRDIESLKIHITDILRIKGDYPSTDWPNTWVLRQGKGPPSPWVTYPLIGLGVLLILAGIPIWWFAWQVWKAVREK
jgi:hypothetical protein